LKKRLARVLSLSMSARYEKIRTFVGSRSPHDVQADTSVAWRGESMRYAPLVVKGGAEGESLKRRSCPSESVVERTMRRTSWS
jgi:hypothetical protein